MIMLTHKLIMDARGNCPDCRGVGRLPIENPFYQCKTCNGTGNSKVVWTEPIEVPERYYVHMAWANKVNLRPFKIGYDKLIELPYKVGDTLTVICDACGGRGRICMENNLACGICENGHDNTCFDRHLCSECKGKPELKVKVTAISVVDNEFRMEGQEL